MSILRRAVDSDWPSIKKLFKLNGITSHLDSFIFNKYWFNTSAVNEWNIFLVEDDSSSVRGIMMMIEAPVLLFGSSCIIGWISTGFVDQFKINSTFGAKLYLTIYRKYDLVGALCGNHNSSPINNLLGNSVLDLSMVRHLFVNCEGAFNICSKEKFALLNDKSKLAHKENYEVHKLTTIPSDYSDLWNSVKINFDFIVNQTSDYLKWRYIDAPFLDYSIVQLRKDKKLIALIITRIQSTPVGRALRILDIIVEKKHANNVVKEIGQFASDNNYMFVDFFVIGSYFNKSFKDAGFYNSEDDDIVNNIPNLLSPIDCRQWSGNFNVGGLMMSDINWNNPERILFTKGDGDRDWPTTNDIKAT